MERQALNMRDVRFGLSIGIQGPTLTQEVFDEFVRLTIAIGNCSHRRQFGTSPGRLLVRRLPGLDHRRFYRRIFGTVAGQDAGAAGISADHHSRRDFSPGMVRDWVCIVYGSAGFDYATPALLRNTCFAQESILEGMYNCSNQLKGARDE
jgi:hypothetical protein